MKIKRLGLTTAAAVVVAVVLGSSQWVTRSAGEAAQPLVGCGGPMEFAVPRALGHVKLVGPVQGAKLTVQDEAGKLILQPPELTTENGYFALELTAPLPSRFTLVVTGGTTEGAPFTDSLRLDVEDFEPEHSVLYVNGATTLESIHRARHPGMSLEDAATATRAMLGLNSSQGLGYGLRRDTAFDHAAFLEAISASGATPLSTRLEALSQSFDDTKKTQSFAAKPSGSLLSSGPGDPIKEGLQFIVEERGGEPFGWLFETTLSLDGQAESLTHFDDLIEALHELRLRLNKLGAKREVHKHISSLNRVTRFLEDHIVAAQTRQERCRQKDPTCRVAEVQEQLRIIAEPLPSQHGFAAHLAKLHSMLVGTGTTLDQGLIREVSDFYATNDRFITPKPHLEQFLDYYEGLQLVSTKLLYDARRLTSQSDAGVGPPAEEFKTLRTAIKTQHELLKTLKLQRAPPGTVIHKKTGLITMQAPFSNINPALGRWDNDTTPSEIEYRIEMLPAAQAACDSLSGGPHPSPPLAGLNGWRLPTASELDALIEGAPVSDSENGGVYNWLQEEGQYTYYGSTVKPAGTWDRAFVFGRSAYFSSDFFAGDTYALWNDGNRSADTYMSAKAIPRASAEDHGTFNGMRLPAGTKYRPDPSTIRFAPSNRAPSSVGAWCVHDGPPIDH